MRAVVGKEAPTRRPGPCPRDVDATYRNNATLSIADGLSLDFVTFGFLLNC